MTTHPWNTLAAAGDNHGARAALRTAFEEGGLDPRDAARSAEALGDMTLALRAWQLVLRDQPTDTGAWYALARLHELRGDDARAAECYKRVTALGGNAPAERPAVEAGDPSPTATAGIGNPSDADLIRFASLFSGREGVHARMWKGEGGHGYSPVESTLGPELLRHHVSGEQTLGLYLVRIDNTVTLCCFDLDVTKAAISAVLGDAEATRRLRAELAEAGVDLQRKLKGHGLDPLFVDSGWKGRHYWCFLPHPQPAADVLRWGQAMVAGVRPNNPRLALEFFPKQARVATEGVGNLVKLPLGLHLVSGRRALLLDDAGKPLGDPWARLRSVRRHPLPTPPQPLPQLKGAPAEAAPFAPNPGPGDWSEAEFESSPEVGPVYRGCAVIRALIEQALKERRLGREEAVVLEHSIGHGPDGVRAVNYLYAKIPGWPADVRMGSPHRGSPISCDRIRKRVPALARKHGCDCPLTPRPGDYENPLLHRAERHPKERDPDTDELFELLARAEDRKRTVDAELATLKARAARKLQEIPGHRWAVRGGEWALVDEDGAWQLT